MMCKGILAYMPHIDVSAVFDICGPFSGCHRPLGSGVPCRFPARLTDCCDNMVNTQAAGA
jgi:hypothetical protein